MQRSRGIGSRRVSRRRFLAGSAGLAEGAALALGARLPVFAQADTPTAAATGSDPFGLANTRATSDSSIASGNVAQLGHAWTIQTPELVSNTPLPDGDRVYFADWSGAVYAADVQSGAVLWQKQLGAPNEKWPWHGFAGPGALADGVLYEASVEGDAFAIDTQTGAVKWRIKLTDQANAGSLAAPLVHAGKVFFGLESVEEPLTMMNPKYQPKFRGHVKAVDAATGKTLWGTSLVDAPGNGVAIWGSFALDPDLNLLYLTTGNNYTGSATDLSDSILAVDAGSGKVKWRYQATGDDIWTPANPKGPDVDFGAGPQLFAATIDGQDRKLVGAGQKSGVYWALDRATGEVVWKATVGKSGVGGGIRGEASVGPDAIYAWSNNAWDDTKLGADPTQAPITVMALDPSTGKARWTQTDAQPAIGESAGFLADDVYFVGSLDGTIKAYRAKDGDQLWSATAPGSISSSLSAGGGALFAGIGVPKMFGGMGASGVVAYRSGVSATPVVTTVQPAATPMATPVAG